jgi:outer membrane protein OmpA-like peptidoglycan-associated protein
MRRQISSVAAAAVLAGVSGGAKALSYGVFESLQVTFFHSAETLPAEDRERLSRFAASAIESGHCIEWVVAIGSADRSEGSANMMEKLARRRAHYVANLLTSAGLQGVEPTIPPLAMSPDCKGDSDACVVVEVGMKRRGALTCP